MSVQIHLDQHDVAFYTNLDIISGNVVLTLHSDATITAINVKLEGESKTRLSGPRYPQSPHERPDKIKTEFELHKLLYKVQTVFPGSELLQHGSGNSQFTLAAGRYEYPFQFKFPFNNDCKPITTPFQDLKFGQLNVQFAQEPASHLKRALPPSLGGFPGEAEIRYYIKTTVVRPKFYQENLRFQQGLKFLPIERPRPESQDQEQYARRQHQFQASRKESKLNIFKKLADSDNASVPAVKVDARLPNPPIITCHRPLPLRVLVQRTNESPASLYLSMFQIELLAFTEIRAHDLKRTEVSSWILVSKANMDMVLDEGQGQQSNELYIPSRLWDQILLPNTVIPTFETCNVSRKYELEVRVGLSHSMADRNKPEVAVLPLRLPCEVFSGVTPPAALLDRMRSQRPARPVTVNPTTSKRPGPTSASNTPVTPTHDSKFPTIPALSNPASFTAQPPTEQSDDLPPSYEDAMAEDIGPFDGPREHFETLHAAPRQQPAYSGDSKSSSGLNRHPSERLFAQNAPHPPGPRSELSTEFPPDPNSPVAEEPTSAVSTTFPAASAQEQTSTTSTTQHATQPPTSETTAIDPNDPPGPPLPARKPVGSAPTTSQKEDTSIRKRSI